jgi:hypothetical protein
MWCNRERAAYSLPGLIHRSAWKVCSRKFNSYVSKVVPNCINEVNGVSRSYEARS